jgi:hypothetical protein
LLEGWAKWFITDLLNLKRKALIEWREKILKKYNYTCLKCKTKKNLEVHHVYNVKDYPELMENLKNGIVLCKKCHKEFHKVYGKRKNNPGQILEFLGVKTKNSDKNSANMANLKTPPTEHRFKPGEDPRRNIKGRPKGSKNFKTLFEIAL